ncbi:MAG TPA: hypothetical protein VFQ45_04190 [Longimicrobium sp.]|nr:hypothetical protein [Longimicrobium sp.]
MRRQRIATLLSALVVSALLPLAGSAQQNSDYRGTWVLNRQASDDINVAINRAIAPMNVLVRQIARPRLRSTNTAYPRITIAFDNNNIRVDMQGRPSVSSPASGAPVLWQRETGRTCTQVRGDCIRVTSEWENGKLEQTFQADDGRRVNLYSLSADGRTLTMNVTITSEKLERPLTYKLVYNRGS